MALWLRLEENDQFIEIAEPSLHLYVLDCEKAHPRPPGYRGWFAGPERRLRLRVEFETCVSSDSTYGLMHDLIERFLAHIPKEMVHTLPLPFHERGRTGPALLDNTLRVIWLTARGTTCASVSVSTRPSIELQLGRSVELRGS